MFYSGGCIGYTSGPNYSIRMRKKHCILQACRELESTMIAFLLLMDDPLHLDLSFNHFLPSELRETVLSSELCNNWDLIPPLRR